MTKHSGKVAEGPLREGEDEVSGMAEIAAEATVNPLATNGDIAAIRERVKRQ